MLSVLRQYITKNNQIQENSTAFYMKALLERCKNEALVKQILECTTENREQIIDCEVDPFNHLVHDFHFADVMTSFDNKELNSLDENITINLILGCYLSDDEYIIFGTEESILDAFFGYTNRGRRLIDYHEESILANYINKEFTELEDEFCGIDDDELVDYYKNNEYELTDDYEFVQIMIILDENGAQYTNVCKILKMLGLSEVTPGLWHYVGFGYCGSYELDLSMSSKDIASTSILNLPAIRNVDKYNETLNTYNHVEGYDDYLYILINGILSSSREVIF